MKLIYEMQYKFVILQHQNKCTEAMKDINSCNILKLEDMIEKAANLAIVTHTKPDGDAMGSTIALYHYLTSIGKKSRIVINDEAPSYLDFITNEICEGDLVIHSQNPEAASSDCQRILKALQAHLMCTLFKHLCCAFGCTFRYFCFCGSFVLVVPFHTVLI